MDSKNKFSNTDIIRFKASQFKVNKQSIVEIENKTLKEKKGITNEK